MLGFFLDPGLQKIAFCVIRSAQSQERNRNDKKTGNGIVKRRLGRQVQSKKGRNAAEEKSCDIGDYAFFFIEAVEKE